VLLASPALGESSAGCGSLIADGAEAADWLVCAAPFADQAIEDVRILSADDMEGRAPETPGSAKARAYIVDRFTEIGVLPLSASFEQSFTFTPEGEPEMTGTNIVGQIPGIANDGKLIVVTAHYDHFGIIDGEIYNGADDNASGVAGLLAVAAALSAEPPLHTTIFAVLDAEELGFFGAYALVADPAFPLADVGLNINLDMISKNARDEVYAAGGSHNASIRALVDRLVPMSSVTLLQGHDSRETHDVLEDWTEESDHVAFHERGLPWLYFGVEDHPEYHEPTDDFATIPLEFFRGSIATTLAAFRLFDQNLQAITPPD
jgi:Zn-dependent M28 family amino/carboxypeptidase